MLCVYRGSPSGRSSLLCNIITCSHLMWWNLLLCMYWGSLSGQSSVSLLFNIISCFYLTWWEYLLSFEDYLLDEPVLGCCVIPTALMYSDESICYVSIKYHPNPSQLSPLLDVNNLHSCMKINNFCSGAVACFGCPFDCHYTGDVCASPHPAALPTVVHNHSNDTYAACMVCCVIM